MPAFKGIKLTIVSQWELKTHPEFPHPDCSTQFTNRNPAIEDSTIFPHIDPRSVSTGESKADKILGREQSSISCYIPSLSGARFWLRYNIEEAASAKSSFYYFKLFMNGRHITSWGTNAKTRPSGQIMKALFDPSDRWNYQHKGVLYKNNGTETRSFFFNNKAEALSAANDGGLIEVRVYRALGRKRKLPEPLVYKSQDDYGIVMPTGGLLDNPQDAKFYDYHLEDAKDKPFAVFKFHYRSWETLISQELIPSDHPQHLLMPSASILSLNGNPKQFHAQSLYPSVNVGIPICGDEMENKILKDSPTREHRRSLSATSPAMTWMNTMFAEGPEDSTTASVFHNSNIPISRFSHGSPQPAKTKYSLLELKTSRPLPEPPLTTHSRNLSMATSTSSSVSPSLTPSLIQHLERDTMSPEPELGVAVVQKVTPHRSISKENRIIKAEQVESPKTASTSSQSPVSPQKLSPAEKKKRRGIASPPLGGLFTLPNITIRRKRSSPLGSLPKILTDSDLLVAEQSMLIGEDEDQERIYNITSRSPTESEWLCRTPSPVRDDPEHARIENLWSPRIDRKPPGSGLRQMAKDWYENVRRSTSPEASPNTDFDGKGSRTTSSNWI